MFIKKEEEIILLIYLNFKIDKYIFSSHKMKFKNKNVFHYSINMILSIKSIILKIGSCRNWSTSMEKVIRQRIFWLQWRWISINGTRRGLSA